jgi:hypothetical protein
VSQICYRRDPSHFHQGVAALLTPRHSSPFGRQRSPIHARPLLTSCQPRCRLIVARPQSAQPTAASSTAPRSAPAAATRIRSQTASSAGAPPTAACDAYRTWPACRPSTKQPPSPPRDPGIYIHGLPPGPTHRGRRGPVTPVQYAVIRLGLHPEVMSRLWQALPAPWRIDAQQCLAGDQPQDDWTAAEGAATVKRQLGWQHPAATEATSERTAATQPTTALLTLTVRRGAESPPQVAGNEATAAAALRSSLARIWRVQWDHLHKEVLWRLTVNGVSGAGGHDISCAGTLRACPYGWWPSLDSPEPAQAWRKHAFWPCPVATTARRSYAPASVRRPRAQTPGCCNPRSHLLRHGFGRWCAW